MEVLAALECLAFLRPHKWGHWSTHLETEVEPCAAAPGVSAVLGLLVLDLFCVLCAALTAPLCFSFLHAPIRVQDTKRICILLCCQNL